MQLVSTEDFRSRSHRILVLDWYIHWQPISCCAWPETILHCSLERPHTIDNTSPANSTSSDSHILERLSEFTYWEGRGISRRIHEIFLNVLEHVLPHPTSNQNASYALGGIHVLLILILQYLFSVNMTQGESHGLSSSAATELYKKKLARYYMEISSLSDYLKWLLEGSKNANHPILLSKMSREEYLPLFQYIFILKNSVCQCTLWYQEESGIVVLCLSPKARSSSSWTVGKLTWRMALEHPPELYERHGKLSGELVNYMT